MRMQLRFWIIKKYMCTWWNYLAKHLKICHIFGIKKQCIFFFFSHFNLFYELYSSLFLIALFNCWHHDFTLFFKERVPAFYDRLYEALHLLVDYFSINGEGLTGSKLYTENYNRMKLLYGLNKVCIFIIVTL